jgi:hypothetical protein
MTSFQVKVLQQKFTLLHADFSKIVLKYSNEVHLLASLLDTTDFNPRVTDTALNNRSQVNKANPASNNQLRITLSRLL